MQIDIQHQSSPGLRIVDKIENGKIVWIYGYNGVGKSMAAKILELVSLNHVFEREAEFEGLRSSIKSCKITIRTDEGETYTVKLTPDRWALDDNRKVKAVTIGEYSLGTVRISPGDFQNAFDVRMIRGNESIATQVGYMISAAKEHFSESFARVRKSQEGARALINDLTAKLGLDQLEIYEERTRALEEQRNAEKSLKDALNGRRTATDYLLKVQEFDRILKLQAEKNIEKLRHEISVIAKSVLSNQREEANLEKERDSVRDRIREIWSLKAHALDRMVYQLQNEEQQLVELNQDLLKQVSELSPQISAEGGFAKLGDLIGQRQNALSEEENQLRHRMSESELQKALVDTALRIRRALLMKKEAEDSIIAFGSIQAADEISLSVKELRRLVDNRLAELKDLMSTQTQKDYEESLLRIKEQEERLEALEKMVKVKHRLEVSIEGARKDISRIGGGEPAEVKNLTEKLGGIDDTRLQLQQARRDLQGKRVELESLSRDLVESPPVKVLHSERARAVSELEKLGITIRESREVVVTISENNRLITSQEVELESTIAQGEAISKEMAALREFFDAKIASSRKLGGYEFVGRWLVRQSGSAIQKFTLLRDELDRFTNSIGSLQNNTQDVLNSLNQLYIIQRSPESEIEITNKEILDRLRLLYDDTFQRIYSNSVFMKYLFPEYTELTSFDIVKNEMKLRDSLKTEHERSISDFSTGEKAFAFSVAMMELAMDRPVKHRIVFLDEFGALLDYIHQDVLLQRIRTRLFAEGKAEKVVILLPVRQRLEEKEHELRKSLEAAATDNERTQTKELIDSTHKDIASLSTRGYYESIDN